MASHQVIPGNLVCFDKFEDVEQKFKDILHLVKNVGFTKYLETNTRIFSTLVKEFYSNAAYRGNTLITKVKEISLQMGVSEINLSLGVPNGGITSFDKIDTEHGLQLMGYEKKSLLKGIKKKDFPQQYEFLADIVGNCILCKDTAYDTVSEEQLRLMTDIVLGKKIFLSGFPTR